MPGRVVIPIHMRKRKPKNGPRYRDPYAAKLSNSVMIIVGGFFAILVGCLLTLLGVRDVAGPNGTPLSTKTLIVVGPILMVLGLGVAVAGGTIYSHFYRQKRDRDSKAAAIRSGTFKLQNSNHFLLQDMSLSSAQCSSAEDLEHCHLVKKKVSTRIGSESEGHAV